MSHDKLCPKPPALFVREATGLVRAWSPTDAAIWNFLNASIMGLSFYTFMPVESPGGNMLLALLLLTFVSIPYFLTYNMLAAAMPRSGGDYIYQSRLLHPALAFTLVQEGFGAFPLGLPISVAFGGWFLVYLGLAPMCLRLGLLWNSALLTGFGLWMTTPSGLFIVTLITIGTAALAIFVGMERYAKIQWFQLVAVVAAIIVMYIAVLSLTHDSFVSSLNSAMAQLGNGSDFYDATITAAKAGGFNANPPFSLYNTIGLWAFWWGTAAWYANSVYLSGEIRQASSFRKQAFSSLGALFLMNIGVYLLIGYLFLNVAGYEFFNSFSWVSFSGNLTKYLPGVPPNIPSLLMLLMNNPIFVIIVGVGFAVQAWQISINSIIPGTRTIMAAAFDRALPDCLADVNDRFHVPLKAIVLFVALSIITAVILDFTSYVTFFVGTFLVIAFSLPTAIGAIIFPYRKSLKTTYETSPIAKYKVGSIPLISILGTWSLVFQAILIYYYIIYPYLIPNLASWATMIGGWVFFGALFYVMRWYRGKQGIPLDLVYKEIPPE